MKNVTLNLRALPLNLLMGLNVDIAYAQKTYVLVVSGPNFF